MLQLDKMQKLESKIEGADLREKIRAGHINRYEMIETLKELGEEPP